MLYLILFISMLFSSIFAFGILLNIIKAYSYPLDTRSLLALVAFVASFFGGSLLAGKEMADQKHSFKPIFFILFIAVVSFLFSNPEFPFSRAMLRMQNAAYVCTKIKNKKVEVILVTGNVAWIRIWNNRIKQVDIKDLEFFHLVPREEKCPGSCSEENIGLRSRPAGVFGKRFVMAK